jgi:hypothetical protein
MAGLRLFHHQSAHLYCIQSDVQARLHPAAEMPVPQIARLQFGGIGQRNYSRFRPASIQPLRIRLRGTRKPTATPSGRFSIS